MPQENQFFHKALSQGEEEELARRYARLVQSCVRPYFLTGGDFYLAGILMIWCRKE